MHRKKKRIHIVCVIVPMTQTNVCLTTDTRELTYLDTHHHGRAMVYKEEEEERRRNLAKKSGGGGALRNA